MQEFEPTDAPAAAIPLTRRALSLAVQALVVCIVFWPMLRGEFVYDDLWLVAQNPSLSSFQQMWSSLGGGYWDFIDPRSSQSSGYWRPLTTTVLYLGNSLGNGSPTAFHALALALHISAVALVSALTWRLTRDFALAFCVGLLFGLHPVQVEPVSWIASINDPLQGAFSLAALLAFLIWRERGSNGLPFSSAALFLCALLSKENALAGLPLFFVLDLGRRQRAGTDEPLANSLRPFMRPYATLLGACAVYYFARVLVFGDIWAGLERSSGQLGLSFGRELSARVELFGGSLALLIWPRTLNLFRDTRPEIPWNDAALWIAVLCSVSWTIAVVWSWRRRARPMLAGLLVIPAGLAPVLLRIEAAGRFALSERYLYVSVFGFVLFAVLAVSQFTARLALQRVSYFVLILVALLFGWRARERTHAWQDERTLFARSYEDNPKSPYVAWGLGRVMIEDYRYSEQLEFLQQARAAFEHSLDLGLKGADGTRDPEVLVTEEDRLQANMGLGWYYYFAALRGYDETTLDEALAVFEKTLSFFPRSYEALTATGIVLLEQRNFAAAEARFGQALKLNPKHLEAWYYLGRLEMQRHKLPAAKEAFEHALALKPNDADTLPRYAGVLAEQGDSVGAQRALDQALRIAPDSPEVLMGLGMLAAKNRDGGVALAWFDRMLKLSPNYAPAYLQKGKVFLAMGQTERALAALQKACELSPRDFEAHYTLGAFLANQGLGKEALPFLQRALDVDPANALADEIHAQIELIGKQ